ncbi:hypothetical protein [Bacillus sp. XF8]|uniref:hypothetical protein n=1 Tax=Bacillus sp. XF8 TaxID=2819289 RepID=UPI001FB6F3E9|nr:hypothetical protein [Bacillus sp. XF8]
MQGFIKDYRQELGSDIWLMPPMYHRVWQWLKYQVNHQDNEIPMRDGSKFLIKRGQHLTSVRNIAQGVGYYEGTKWKEPNPKTISTILGWLEKQEMILIERGQGNRQYTLITLLNWDSYQAKKDEGNSKGTAEKHLADINKNDKNNVVVEEESNIENLTERQVNLITDKYMKLKGRGFPSPDDYTIASQLLQEGVPFNEILFYLDECFNNFTPKHSMDRINSFRYCASYIYNRWHSKQQANKPLTVISGKQGRRQAKNEELLAKYE